MKATIVRFLYINIEVRDLKPTRTCIALESSGTTGSTEYRAPVYRLTPVFRFFGGVLFAQKIVERYRRHIFSHLLKR